jgi:hypothetical protein
MPIAAGTSSIPVYDTLEEGALALVAAIARAPNAWTLRRRSGGFSGPLFVTSGGGAQNLGVHSAVAELKFETLPERGCGRGADGVSICVPHECEAALEHALVA